jgi:hypothetical protein
VFLEGDGDDQESEAMKVIQIKDGREWKGMEWSITEHNGAYQNGTYRSITGQRNIMEHNGTTEHNGG